MTDVERALNSLREQRRNAERGMQKAKRAGNQIQEQTFRREVRRLDAEIENLRSE